MPEPWEDPQEEIRQLLDGLQERLKKGILPAKLFLGIAGVVLGGLFLLSSVYTVDPEEKAVVLRFGRYIDTKGPGPHLRLPFGIDQVVKIPTERVLHEDFGFRGASASDGQSIPEESLMLTGELNVAEVEWVVQYKISDPRKFLFETRDVQKNLRDVSQSVLRRVVGDRTVSEVLTTGRDEIAIEAERITQEILDRYKTGVEIQSVQLQDINPPAAVRPAFNEVNEAKQEQEKAINEAEREYNRIIEEARGKAQKQILDAEGYATAVVNRAKGEASRFADVLRGYRSAPRITKTRLYLETLEQIYPHFKEMTIVDKGVSGVLPVFSDPKALLPSAPK